MKESDEYDLDLLYDILLEIIHRQGGHVSYPKALYCLCKEVKRLEKRVNFLIDRIPLSDRKVNAGPDENPFFSKLDLHFPLGGIPTDSFELESAKKRMEKYYKESTQETSEECPTSSQEH